MYNLKHYHIGFGEIKDFDLEKEIFNSISRYDINHPKMSDDSLINLYHYNLRNFKRHAIGICSSYTSKSVNDLSKLLVNIDIVDSVSDGKKLVEKLVEYSGNNKLRYSTISYLQSSYVAGEALDKNNPRHNPTVCIAQVSHKF